MREVHLEESSPEEKDCSEVEMLCQLEQCVKALQYHSQNQRSRGNAAVQRPGVARWRGVCWNCEEADHIQRHCTKLAAGARGSTGSADRQDKGNDQ